MLKKELPGTKLLLIDDLHPEDLAMLQALYSRSAESAEDHIQKIRDAGSGKFMNKFYVGYNHKSIADCGSTTFFLEGVSMFAAKAIQDWPLYSGQETSTRYIDMSKQRIIDPVGTTSSAEILSKWMDFYRSSQEPVASEVRRRYPQNEGEKDGDYAGAVKARTFDILRGFLPSGICTQLSWHTNLRQAGDHIKGLSYHPAAEIRNIGLALQEMLKEKYPSTATVNAAAVTGVTGNENLREFWENKASYALTYTSSFGFPGVQGGEARFSTTVKKEYFAEFSSLLKTRPRGCVLPHVMSDLGQCSFAFLLDFGSFRDIQRHRNGVCRMPLLTLEDGFEPWYIDQLPEDLRKKATELIIEQEASIKLVLDMIDRQYYIPMGYRVPCQITYGLPATVYVLETRSSKTVHPTLRRVIQEGVKQFEERFPNIALHVDRDPDGWTVRRGTQTITEKK